jgi:hypothetical protein
VLKKKINEIKNGAKDNKIENKISLIPTSYNDSVSKGCGSTLTTATTLSPNASSDENIAKLEYKLKNEQRLSL